MKYGSLATLVFFCFFYLLIRFLPLDNSRFSRTSSVTVFSDEGIPLRVFRNEMQGAYSQSLPLSLYPKHLIKAVLAAEDSRFFYHPGFDPLAISRSLLNNIQAGKIISGGSTITQQLVRVLFPDILPRNPYARKIVEIFLAMSLEARMTKTEILENYINKISMPYNQMGMASASVKIFRKTPTLLTKDESLSLAILIRGSNIGFNTFFSRYKRLLNTLNSDKATDALNNEDFKKQVKGYYDKFRESENTRNENPDYYLSDKAPHFINWLESVYHLKSRPENIQTTLSSELNNTISEIIENEIQSIPDSQQINCSVIVLELEPDPENKQLKLRAMIGSRDFSKTDEGQVNGTTAVRNGGSTLKPFIYGTGMETLGLMPFSIIDDSEMSMEADPEGETYRPKNYDLNFWGKITVRDALANSRNIPAVYLLKKTGIDTFFALLKNLGFSHIVNNPSYYGPGSALGTAGVSLLDLTRAYSLFPNHGQLLPIVVSVNSKNKQAITYGKTRKIFKPATAYHITDILSDGEARKRAFGSRSFLDFPFEVAAKTGTSKDYRDAWTVGYTGRYIVGVWMGNFSGESMNNVPGAYGAGRIFQQIMRHLYRNHKSSQVRFHYPDTWKKIPVCISSGKAATKFCPVKNEWIGPGEKVPSLCTHHQGNSSEEPESAAVLVNETPSDETPEPETDGRYTKSPVQGEVYILDPDSPLKWQEVPVRFNLPFEGGYYYVLDGIKKENAKGDFVRTVALKPGIHNLKLYYKNDVIESVDFSVR